MYNGEDIRNHQSARQLQILKGFSEVQDILEKARNVGDVHANGKWVWTQLPNGKFDWRVIKKLTTTHKPVTPRDETKEAHQKRGFDESKGDEDVTGKSSKVPDDKKWGAASLSSLKKEVTLTNDILKNLKSNFKSMGAPNGIIHFWDKDTKEYVAKTEVYNGKGIYRFSDALDKDGNKKSVVAPTTKKTTTKKAANPKLSYVTDGAPPRALPKGEWKIKDDFKAGPGGGWYLTFKEGQLLRSDGNGKLETSKDDGETWKLRRPPIQNTNTLIFTQYARWPEQRVMYNKFVKNLE